MKQTIDEYKQIRKTLGIIRSIMESEENYINKDILNPNPDVLDKSGDKIVFSKINTQGFLKTELNFSDEEKASFAYGVEQLITSSGLIAKSVKIGVEDGRVIIISDTIQNPELRDIRHIKIDTNEPNVEIALTGNTLILSEELSMLLSSIVNSYNDPQNGRDGLIKLTQQTLKI